MNINSVTSMARMAYKLSNLKNFDHASGQFVINPFSNITNNGTNSSTNTGSGTQTDFGSDYDLMISNKSKREYAKQQALLQKKQNALKSIETSTTKLQDATVSMSQNDYSNSDKTVDNLRGFIDSYNKNLNTASKNAKIENTALKLQVDMQQARYSSRSYASIGINVNKNGSLSLDETKFRAALETNQDKVGNLIGGSNGLLAKTASVTDQYLGTTTVLNTYRPESTGSLNGSGNVGSGLETDNVGSSAYEKALISSVSSLYDSNTTLLNADFEASEDDAIVDAMKKYAADYTSVVDTLSSYKKDNYSAEYYGLEFAEPRFKSKLYGSIGLNVSNNGSMSVDETAFRDALANNRAKVIDMLQGDSGLLNKTNDLIGSMFA